MRGHNINTSRLKNQVISKHQRLTWLKSALMSSMCSSPTLTRMRSGVTPDAICSTSVSCWCVVTLGAMTRVLASPTLACAASRNQVYTCMEEGENRMLTTHATCTHRGPRKNFIILPTKWLASFNASVNLAAAAWPPLIPKFNMEP